MVFKFIYISKFLIIILNLYIYSYIIIFLNLFIIYSLINLLNIKKKNKKIIIIIKNKIK